MSDDWKKNVVPKASQKKKNCKDLQRGIETIKTMWLGPTKTLYQIASNCVQSIRKSWQSLASPSTYCGTFQTVCSSTWSLFDWKRRGLQRCLYRNLP